MALSGGELQSVNQVFGQVSDAIPCGGGKPALSSDGVGERADTVAVELPRVRLQIIRGKWPPE